MNITPLAEWVNERHAIYLRKELRAGRTSDSLNIPEAYRSELEWSAKAPGRTYLTRDPILQKYRFCNVFRELDRVTQWIHYNIRRRYADHPNLWFMLAIARTINWPDTLQYLMEYEGAWPHYHESCDEFTPAGLGRALDTRRESGNKIYTGAYMVRAPNHPSTLGWGWSKQRYIAEIVIGRLWEDRVTWTAKLDPELRPGFSTLKGAWEMFQQPRYIGWGPFMTYQVVVDLRHTRYLRGASDIQEWSALGPGSRRGLNRLAGRPLDYPLKQDDGLEEMRSLHRSQDQWKAPWVPPIDLSDIQNCLCEVDKYLRAKNGEGKPRTKYVSGRGW